MGCVCCKHDDEEEYRNLLTSNIPLIQAIADTDEDLLQDPEIVAIIGGKNDINDNMNDEELEEYIKTLNPTT